MQVTPMADGGASLGFLDAGEIVDALRTNPEAEIYDMQGYRLVLTRAGSRAVRAVPNEQDKEPANMLRREFDATEAKGYATAQAPPGGSDG